MLVRFSARYVLTTCLLPGILTGKLLTSKKGQCIIVYCHVLQASAMGMVPPRYAWIIHGWFHEGFWKQRPSNETSYQAFDQCSSEQIKSIVNQMIVIHSDPRYDERDRGNPIIGNRVRSRLS